MKLLFTGVLVLFLQYSFATTYYISPKGDDRTGNGSISNPWQTLYRATSAVTTAGDIIHVTAGTYVEKTRCNLAVGVSIEGDGPTSVIQSTLSEQFVAIIIATSPEGTNGNQHISNIKLDGNKRTTSWAIEIRGRSNFSVYDCTITDFEETGVYFGGRNDNTDEAPAIYAKGNSFYNNMLTNCAKYDGYGRGCLVIGGQDGMLIYNNIISQTGRAKGTNGWPIKYCNNGFLNGCKIYNNKITKQAYDGTSWDFAIELFNESGLEIYNNTIIGSLDMNHQTKGKYAYSVYIHDNIFGPTVLQPRMETGMTLEYETEMAIIENNQFRNLGIPIYFTPRDGSLISDVIINNNVCENIGVANGSHRGFAINFTSDGTGKHMISNFFVTNNKFIANAKEAPYYGIEITGNESITNIKIKNNTIKNFSVACIIANPAFVIDTLLIENNILSGNGNNNNPFYIRGTPDNYTIKNNIKASSPSGSNPGFNFKQQIVRPVYYEIKNISPLEYIAVFAIILCVWFSRKENIYVFPTGLLVAFIYIFLSFDTRYPGGSFVSFYFILLCIYGWVMWRKRDRRHHRIVRITASTKKELLLQLVFFASFFTVIYFLFTYYKTFFTPGTIPWADAFATATACTGMWLLTRKKAENWYWWMATCMILIPLSFAKHNVFNSLYYLMLLVTAVWGLYKWKRRMVIKR